MDHRQSLPFAQALKDVLNRGYTRRNVISDLTAGATVGIVALPLAMALAIASGVAPQHGRRISRSTASQGCHRRSLCEANNRSS